MEGYYGRTKSCSALNVHYHTLYRMARDNEIDTIKVGKKTLFNVKKYLEEKGVTVNKK